MYTIPSNRRAGMRNRKGGGGGRGRAGGRWRPRSPSSVSVIVLAGHVAVFVTGIGCRYFYVLFLEGGFAVPWDERWG